MKKLIVTLAAVLALGGCIKMSTTPPTDLPAYVKIMPGGQQMMTMDMGAMKAEVFQTTTSSDDVLTFYRTQAQSDGLTETATQPQANATPDQKQATFADTATGRMLVVVAKPQSGETMVTLMYPPVVAKATS
jgi:hypothetical protein